MDSNYILAIDQGTTSSRAILFDDKHLPVASAQEEFVQHFPRSGWVEHDPQDLMQTTLSCCRAVLDKMNFSAIDIAAIGITNQRETTLMWDRHSGKPVYNAIVWQDRRTADYCDELREGGHEQVVTEKTGLLLDPYFSGTKIAWILDNVDGVRTAAEKGDLLFGTVDTWLIWNLTGGKRHVTDATNASRTLIYNIHEGCWDDELLSLLKIPKSVLPKVQDCASDFGYTDVKYFGGEIAIAGVAGDQQAATIGQACFEPGMMKSTYGTGCFALLNTGKQAVRSKNRMLTTIASQLNGEVTYALEGSIFIAGAAVQWLRDGLGLIDQASQSGELAKSADLEQDVYMVPAFAGMGAPHWDPHARGAIFGLTRATGPAEMAKAALEAVCYQTHDLLEAMMADWQGNAEQTVLRVDGGMAASDWTMQCLADVLNAPVDRPVVQETTALGAAWLAGSYVGVRGDQTEFSKSWNCEKRFLPNMDPNIRDRKIAGWKDAVRRTLVN
ncbi:MAG: glycerol kinase [Hyphomicrobiales bacterium]|nr:MAG: glycerol kinase [Hyphomicrobiales bacterium]